MTYPNNNTTLQVKVESKYHKATCIDNHDTTVDVFTYSNGEIEYTRCKICNARIYKLGDEIHYTEKVKVIDHNLVYLNIDTIDEFIKSYNYLSDGLGILNLVALNNLLSDDKLKEIYIYDLNKYDLNNLLDEKIDMSRASVNYVKEISNYILDTLEFKYKNNNIDNTEIKNKLGNKLMFYFKSMEKIQNINKDYKNFSRLIIWHDTMYLMHKDNLKTYIFTDFRINF